MVCEAKIKKVKKKKKNQGKKRRLVGKNSKNLLEMPRVY